MSVYFSQSVSKLQPAVLKLNTLIGTAAFESEFSNSICS